MALGPGALRRECQPTDDGISGREQWAYFCKYWKNWKLEHQLLLEGQFLWSSTAIGSPQEQQAYRATESKQGGVLATPNCRLPWKKNSVYPPIDIRITLPAVCMSSRGKWKLTEAEPELKKKAIVRFNMVIF